NTDVMVGNSFDGRFIIIRKGKKNYNLVKLGE
ncbi:hypothetical protein ACR3AM_006621, partial [Bacillus thuringiensis]